jgi:eukaryotic-like serine/threonine-protein kinase
MAPLENSFPVGPSVAVASRMRADDPVEAHAQLGLGPWGTYNTLGNVREWVWNAYGNERIALGGSWRDYISTYQLLQAAQPMERRPELGFRVMKSLAPVSDDLLAPITQATDEPYAKRDPVSDDAYGAMRFQFTAAERTPSDVIVERFAESDTWTADEVLLKFGADVFSVYVFLPKAKHGVLQPILYTPPGDAFLYPRPNREVVEQLRFVDLVPNGGRALIIPIWSGTYQRVPPPPANAAAAFDRLRLGALNWYDDAVKTINYLATRNDMDVDRIGSLGISAGAFLIEPMLLAVEGRLKAGVLIGTGISLEKTHPMADAVNYAPRIRVPVLMINGRYDSVFPYELSQMRLFELLGSPAADKKHVVYDVDHFRYPRNSVAKEVTDWFDEYLGPVK